MGQDLNTATSAVREILKEDPKALAKDVPKQNWGTFETAHQRKTGKNVQDTMSEIDRLIGNKQTDDGRKIEEAAEQTGAQTKLGKDIQSLMGKNGIRGGEIRNFNVEPGMQRVGGQNQTTTTVVTETHYHMEGGIRKEGLIGDDKVNKFKAGVGGSNADSFLQQYSDKKAAYYKPGAANIRPGGVN